MKPQYFSSDSVLEEFYHALASGDHATLRRVHIPRSDVFYVRAHLEDVFGEKFSLDRVERSMYLEGMLEAKDCFEPERKRDWE